MRPATRAVCRGAGAFRLHRTRPLPNALCSWRAGGYTGCWPLSPASVAPRASGRAVKTSLLGAIEIAAVRVGLKARPEEYCVAGDRGRRRYGHEHMRSTVLTRPLHCPLDRSSASARASPCRTSSFPRAVAWCGVERIAPRRQPERAPVDSGATRLTSAWSRQAAAARLQADLEEAVWCTSRRVVGAQAFMSTNVPSSSLRRVPSS
jgi:hypothetical protein